MTPKVQMRLLFEAPAQEVELNVSIFGSIVFAEYPHDSEPAVLAHLTAAGISSEAEPSGGVKFSVRQLPLFSRLSEHVKIWPSKDVRPLLELSIYPPSVDSPASVSISEDAAEITWFDGEDQRSYILEDSAITALVASELPFLASPEAWNYITKATSLPPLAGRCVINEDDFCEVAIVRQQLAEAANIPGMFRIDSQFYGVAKHFAELLTSQSGFRWERPPPESADMTFETPKGFGPAGPVFAKIAQHLSERRTAIFDWQSPASKRLAAAGAAALLEETPILVICDPPSLWVWSKYFRSMGCSVSLQSTSTDVRLITYHDVAAGTKLQSPSTIVFDSLTSERAEKCYRFDGLVDTTRIGIVDEWPENPAEVIEVMSVLRPAEFDPTVPLSSRYVNPPSENLHRHISAYQVRLGDRDALQLLESHRQRFSVKQSSVRQETSEEMAAKARVANSSEDVAELCEMLDFGTDYTTSAKMGSLLEVLADKKDAGRVAVLTDSPGVKSMLPILLLPRTCSVWDGEGSYDPVDVVIVAARNPPPLQNFDEVIVASHPPSMSSLESAVCSPDSGPEPAEVILLHSINSLDDRRALLAAQRAENILAPLTASSEAWSPEEVSYLLRRFR